MKLTNIGLSLSVLGSLLIAISPAGTAAFLLAGRMIQGLSAACIMPATLALMKAYFDGKERQRALSFWSIRSWGGSGFCSLFGGFIASTLGWRWIFWISIMVALVSFLLIRGTPESKVSDETSFGHFDWAGLIPFVIGMLALNVVIAQGALSSSAALILIVVFFFRPLLSSKSSEAAPIPLSSSRCSETAHSVERLCRTSFLMAQPERCSSF